MIEKLATLRVDRATGDPAPHKPLLLLVFIDMAEAGELTGDFVPLTPELSYRFCNYWVVVGMRRRQRPDVRLPFHHLGGDGIVRPVTREGKHSIAMEMTLGIVLSEQFRLCLSDPAWRQKARLTLVQTYFRQDEQVTLCEMLGIDQSELKGFDKGSIQEELREKLRASGRDARFRQWVMTAYNYTCALTGQRIITVSAGSLVDAAHITPVASKGACVIGNGLALCKNAHWAFDNGLWTIDDSYKVRICASRFDETVLQDSPVLSFKSLEGRRLYLPRKEEHWPNLEFVKWHRGFSGLT